MERYWIDTIEIAGFRGFLHPQAFALADGAKPRSLAVFAPNAHGKSSIVDAFEYFFSETGTLDRLGEREAGRSAGREPIVHVGAMDAAVDPHVLIRFRYGTETFSGNRPVVTTQTPAPDAALRVAAGQRADRIVRGHELRAFVENRTPEERYRELAKWFELEPITNMQARLRALRKRITTELRDTKAETERTNDLTRLTGGAVSTSDQPAALKWVNEQLLAPLAAAPLSSFRVEDPAYVGLLETRKIEEARAGKASIDAARNCLIDILASPPDGPRIGAGVRFEDALVVVERARAAETEERSKAEKQVFARVWEEAVTVLENPAMDACPVCAVPFGSSGVTREGVADHLRAELASLTSYKSAVDALRTATAGAQQAASKLADALAAARRALVAAGVPDVRMLQAAEEAVRTWTPGDATSPTVEVSAAVAAASAALEAHGANATATNDAGAALKTIDGLREATLRLDEIARERHALESIYETVGRALDATDARVRTHVEKIVATLHEKMNAICHAIQSHAGTPPVYRLELPEGSDKNQQRLLLLCDFMGRQGVVPHGYVSDAQINTLALALRLSAILLLNAEAPFIMLDDVVTSYDADHRKAIAKLLATEFSEAQLILVTHDAQFFRLLREHLPQDRWAFKRITTIDPAFGPRFADHQVTDAQIRARWAVGELAGNEIRRAEEEWLYAKCREFGARLTIRDTERPHSFDRSELAEAFAEAIKGLKLKLPSTAGMAKPMLDSLKGGITENFASHFQADPQAWSSIGDEQIRWQEFTDFCAIFVCASCGRSTFERPRGKDLATCAYRKCCAPFTPDGSAPQAPITLPDRPAAEIPTDA